MSFSCLNHDYATAVQLLIISLFCVRAYEYWKRTVPIVSCAESNSQINLAFSYMQALQIQYQIQYNMSFSCLNHDFATAIQLLGNQFLVCECIFIIERGWYSIFLMCCIQFSKHFSFDRVQVHQIHNIMSFSCLNHNYATAVQLLRISFFCVRDMNYWIVFMCWIQFWNQFGFWFHAMSTNTIQLCLFHAWTMILLLLYSYLEISFLCISV